MNKKILIVTSIAILFVVSLCFALMSTTQPTQLTLRFKAFVDNQPLVLHHKSYPNPGGEGAFTIRDFQFYISNIKYC